MSRYIDKFNEYEILEVVKSYLVDGKSYRVIQRDVLGIPASNNGGGYIAMDIIHHFGIRGDKKAVLQRTNIEDEMKNSSGSYLKILMQLHAFSDEEEKSSMVVKESSNGNYNWTDKGNGKTEISAKTKVRIGQQALRKYVLRNYSSQCALCEIDKEDLLICSHIKPWAAEESNRLNPQNAICLCALHDRLFDRGYISLDDNYQVLLSGKADEIIENIMSGTKFRKPIKDLPDKKLLEYHWKEICGEE